MKNVMSFTWKFQNARLTAVITMDVPEISFNNYEENASLLKSLIKNNIHPTNQDIFVATVIPYNATISVIISKIDSKCKNFICETTEFDEFLQKFIEEIWKVMCMNI